MAKREGLVEAGAFQEYRELVLGVILGVLLALVALTMQTLALSLGVDLRTLSVAIFFTAGLLFGILLWLGSRREGATRRVQQAIASVNTGGVVVDDKDGIIVFANAKFCEMVGRPRSEVLGKSLAEVIAPDSRALADAEFVRRRLGLSSVYETNLRRPDDTMLTTLVSSQSLMAGERYTGSAAFFLDISQRKKSEREVIQAKELAEFFLDLITHDISNVNQGIRGYAEILAATPNAPEGQRRGYMAKILGQVDRANTLIHNIKKISELRWTGNLGADAMVDVEETVRRAIAMSMSSFPELQVEIGFQNHVGHVEARADYLATELFYNLIHNAVKYTPGPKVDVEVEIDRSAGGSTLVRISDRGPGIPDNAKNSLFTRIEAGAGETQPSGYHSGTGLTLVRLIAERYGWKVWVENRERGEFRKGSVFVIEVPTG